MDEIDMLTKQAQYLERENRKLRRTLRDEFALAALAGLMVDMGTPAEFSQSIAADAYLIADAMLEARKS